jgi:hypothetical protein
MEKLIFTKSIIKDGLNSNEITRRLAQRYGEDFFFACKYATGKGSFSYIAKRRII